jgi:hypothetical protein
MKRTEEEKCLGSTTAPILLPGQQKFQTRSNEYSSAAFIRPFSHPPSVVIIQSGGQWTSS